MNEIGVVQREPQTIRKFGGIDLQMKRPPTDGGGGGSSVVCSTLLSYNYKLTKNHYHISSGGFLTDPGMPSEQCCSEKTKSSSST